MAEIELKKTDKYEFNYTYNKWLEMKPLGSYKSGGKTRLDIQFTDDNRKPFDGPKVPPPRLPISEIKITFNNKINKGFNIRNKNFTNDTFCKMKFIGFPKTMRTIRVIENYSSPFWDEFH